MWFFAHEIFDSTVRGVSDHYYANSPGSHAAGRSVETELISGFDLGDWRDRVPAPEDVPCYVTAEEQVEVFGATAFTEEYAAEAEQPAAIIVNTHRTATYSTFTARLGNMSRSEWVSTTASAHIWREGGWRRLRFA